MRFLGAIFILFSGMVQAAEFKVPQLTGPVVDQAGVLSRSSAATVENALRYLHSQGGSQINVLTLRSLEGLPIEQASIKIVDQWKLGGKKPDNGLLLLIAPTEHKLRIEVGQGLEGSLTDADSKRIIDQTMVPLIRKGDFDSAVITGVYQIALKTDPTIDLRPYLEGRVRSRPATDGGIPIRFWMIILFFVIFFFINPFLRRRGGGGYYGGWGGGGFGGGGFGGGGGSSGGGNWGGGGGGFSGGGASGDW